MMGSSAYDLRRHSLRRALRHHRSRAAVQSYMELLMTRQEAFDTVARKMLAQGDVAFSAGLCRYITQDGRRCAIGHLLSEEAAKYWTKRDFGSVENVSVHFLPNFMREDLNFYSDLQLAHDICVKANNFKSNFIFYMKQVANKYDLSTDALHE
jgi:hypothetical protein